jgi:hypothetical protein
MPLGSGIVKFCSKKETNRVKSFEHVIMNSNKLDEQLLVSPLASKAYQ